MEDADITGGCRLCLLTLREEFHVDSSVICEFLLTPIELIHQLTDQSSFSHLLQQTCRITKEEMSLQSVLPQSVFGFKWGIYILCKRHRWFPRTLLDLSFGGMKHDMNWAEIVSCDLLLVREKYHVINLCCQREENVCVCNIHWHPHGGRVETYISLKNVSMTSLSHHSHTVSACRKPDIIKRLLSGQQMYPGPYKNACLPHMHWQNKDWANTCKAQGLIALSAT